MSKPLIRVIGSLHLDFVTITPRCPSAGETLQGSSFDIGAGGKGANQAAACGRASFVSTNEQDVEVEMVGAVGKDDPYYASLLQPALQKSGVSTTHIAHIAGTTTGSATIIVEATGENRIIFVPGAGFIGNDDREEVLSRGSDREPDVVVLQGEIPRDTILAVIEHYNASENTQVVFNPAPVFPEGVPIRVLRGLAALVVNESEALLLMKSMADEVMNESHAEREEELDQNALKTVSQNLHAVGVLTVIITLGSKGVFWSRQDRGSAVINATKVEKVVDTTAAGDTFVGYFTTELARASAQKKELDVATACGKASEAAAKCVTRPGAMQSIPFGYE